MDGCKDMIRSQGLCFFCEPRLKLGRLELLTFTNISWKSVSSVQVKKSTSRGLIHSRTGTLLSVKTSQGILGLEN